jgi:hypothetical protein
MEGSNNFWESALLRNKADKCIFHMILPTIMTTRHPSWDKIKSLISRTDEEIIQAQRDNLSCVYCKKDTQSQTIRLAIRIVISREDFDNGHLYRCGVGCASICNTCSNLDVNSFDSDTPMHEAMFDRLEMVGREVSFLNMRQKIDGPEFMRQLMEGFHTNYPSFIRQLRKLEAKKCYYCKKTPPKLSYCSVCRYVRYCSDTCQHADWKIHKHECKFMVTNSIFFDYKKYGKRVR